jgi:pSer/pThr/pTyr-binding forkhead associated (FHA) protein
MISEKSVESPLARSGWDTIARLIAVDGPLSGRTFYLEEPLVSIGRLESNDICLEDPFVSRHHCLIRKQGDGYMIEDLHSANGTCVNGERVNLGSLNEGCQIEIGGSRFLFKVQKREDPITLGQNLLVAENGRAPLDELRSA